MSLQAFADRLGRLEDTLQGLQPCLQPAAANHEDLVPQSPETPAPISKAPTHAPRWQMESHELVVIARSMINSLTEVAASKTASSHWPSSKPGRYRPAPARRDVPGPSHAMCVKAGVLSDSLSVIGVPLSNARKDDITSWATSVNPAPDAGPVPAQVGIEADNQGRESASGPPSSNPTINEAINQRRIRHALELIQKRDLLAAAELLNECSEGLESPAGVMACKKLVSGLYSETSPRPGDSGIDHLATVDRISARHPRLALELAEIRLEKARDLLSRRKTEDARQILQGYLPDTERVSGAVSPLSNLPTWISRKILRVLAIAMAYSGASDPQATYLFTHLSQSAECPAPEKAEYLHWLGICDLARGSLGTAYNHAKSAFEIRASISPEPDSKTICSQLLVALCRHRQKHADLNVWVDMLGPKCFWAVDVTMASNRETRVILADLFVHLLRTRYTYSLSAATYPELQPCWTCIRRGILRSEALSISYVSSKTLCDNHLKMRWRRGSTPLAISALHYLSASTAGSPGWGDIWNTPTSKGVRGFRGAFQGPEYHACLRASGRVSPMTLAIISGNSAAIQHFVMTLEDLDIRWCNVQEVLLSVVTLLAQNNEPTWLVGTQETALRTFISLLPERITGTLPISSKIADQLLFDGVVLLSAILTETGPLLTIEVSDNQDTACPLLHYAAQKSDLRYTAGVNLVFSRASALSLPFGPEGFTPLHAVVNAACIMDNAAAGNDGELVLFPEQDQTATEARISTLIQAGADLMALDSSGRTPCRLARERRIWLSREVYQMLDCGSSACPNIPSSLELAPIRSRLKRLLRPSSRQ